MKHSSLLVGVTAVVSAFLCSPMVAAENVPSGDLQIVVTDNQDVVKPGDVLTYSIVVSNPSENDATDVTVMHLLPPSVTFVLASDAGAVSGQFVRWNTVEIPAHTARTLALYARVSGDVPHGMMLRSTAQIEGGASAKDSTTLERDEAVAALRQQALDAEAAEGASIAHAADFHAKQEASGQSILATALEVSRLQPAKNATPSVSSGVWVTLLLTGLSLAVWRSLRSSVQDIDNW